MSELKYESVSSTHSVKKHSLLSQFILKVISPFATTARVFKDNQFSPMFAPSSDATSLLSAYKLLHTLQREEVILDLKFALSSYCDEPKLYSTQVSISGKQRSGFSGSSHSLFDESETVWPALGEALERWCLDNFLPPQSQWWSGTINEFQQKSTFDLGALAGIDPQWRIAQSTHNLNFSDTSFINWTSCTSLTTPHKTIFAPLRWFTFKKFHQGNTHKEPVLLPSVTTGAAAGQNLTTALLSGMLEIIERDAFMIYWMRKITPQKINISNLYHPRIRKISEIIDRYQLETHFLYLKTDMDVPVVATVVIDRTGIGPAITIDASADFDLDKAIIKSFTGAVMQRSGLRKQMEKGSHNQYWETDILKLTLKDRRLWWCFQERLPLIDFLISGEYVKNQDTLWMKPKFSEVQQQLTHLITLCKEKNYTALYKEVIPPRIKKIIHPITVVFVRMPDFQPLHLNEYERCSYGKRLIDVPKILNLHPKCETNDIPHPFA